VHYSEFVNRGRIQLGGFVKDRQGAEALVRENNFPIELRRSVLDIFPSSPQVR
jgi:hypothetical protein